MAKKKAIPDIQKRLRQMVAQVTREEAARQKRSDALVLKASGLVARADKAIDAGKHGLAVRYQERAQRVLDEWQALQNKR
jgi:phage shock protein A